VHFPTPDTRTVSVCWTDASLVTPRDADPWLAQLPSDEQQRFRRYRRPLDAHQFLVGRLLVRRWLADLTGQSAAAWRFSEGARGRPGVASPHTDWSFNLAHSGGLVACAIAHAVDVGVDLEDMDRRPMTRDLAQRFCAPAEFADIERQPEAERTQRFLTYWTLKEAYLKARGLGIAVHLADVAFSLDGPHPTITFLGSLIGTSADWAFELFQPTPRYVLSVAAPLGVDHTRPLITVTPLPLTTLMPGGAGD